MDLFQTYERWLWKGPAKAKPMKVMESMQKNATCSYTASSLPFLFCISGSALSPDSLALDWMVSRIFSLMCHMTWIIDLATKDCFEKKLRNLKFVFLLLLLTKWLAPLSFSFRQFQILMKALDAIFKNPKCSLPNFVQYKSCWLCCNLYETIPMWSGLQAYSLWIYTEGRASLSVGGDCCKQHMLHHWCRAPLFCQPWVRTQHFPPLSSPLPLFPALLPSCCQCTGAGAGAPGL